MKRLSRRIVRANLEESLEQLEDVLAILRAGKPLPEEHFAVMIAHAYHHLNVAWNARNAPMARYRKMTSRDYNLWASFPRDLELNLLSEGKSTRGE